MELCGSSAVEDGVVLLPDGGRSKCIAARRGQGKGEEEWKQKEVEVMVAGGKKYTDRCTRQTGGDEGE